MPPSWNLSHLHFTVFHSTVLFSHIEGSLEGWCLCYFHDFAWGADFVCVIGLVSHILSNAMQIISGWLWLACLYSMSHCVQTHTLLFLITEGRTGMLHAGLESAPPVWVYWTQASCWDSPMLECLSRRQIRASLSSFWWSEDQTQKEQLSTFNHCTSTSVKTQTLSVTNCIH